MRKTCSSELSPAQNRVEWTTDRELAAQKCFEWQDPGAKVGRVDDFGIHSTAFCAATLPLDRNLRRNPVTRPQFAPAAPT
jgi:hypothetical protein